MWVEHLWPWITQNYVELVATVTGLIYLYYSIQGNKLLWIYGFITSGIYVFVCYQAGIYADMGINLYYVGVSIYGWLHWTFYRTEKESEIPVTKTRLIEFLVLSLVTLFFYVFITFILVRYTDSTIPYWDALTTSLSITATWMLARKMLEHWLIWIFVDAVSVALYLYKGLYSTSFLFLVYTVMAVIGYLQWKKQIKTQEQK